MPQRPSFLPAPARSRWRAWPSGAGLLAVGVATLCRAQGGIYTCTDERGRRLTSDRPIPECLAREQRVLNHDGSLKAVRPPSMTPDERAEQELRERRAAEARVAQADAVRRDRNLLQRYRNEAAHQKAREQALEGVRAVQSATQRRLAELERERQTLLAEAEFYRSRPMPPRLKTQLDANDAALQAQRDALSSQEAEIGRLTQLYDLELERLRRLWQGAAPGSLGALPAVAPASAPAASDPARTAARPPARAPAASAAGRPASG